MTGWILGRVMLGFEGEVLPESIARRLADAPAAGMTVFRHHNVRSPGQLREMTDAFQRAGPTGRESPDSAPMLVGADQEGGQLIALGDASTAFAGNMALGAVDDVATTERVGFAIGTEARAMGVNVVYAPCLDVASDPANPALGIRSFGEDPDLVGRHGVAMVRGLQAAGVAAAVKHAPGMGAVATDTHHGLAVADAARDVLDAREFVPFRAAFAAGVRMVMSGHLALPAVSGARDLPATLSRAVMTDLLRGDLGFDGVSISDALDMGAVASGPDATPDVVAAVRAGVDLLLTAADPAARDRMEAALRAAEAAGAFDLGELAATERRLATLRGWLGSSERGPVPDPSVVGAAAHQGIAADLAARSITLVRDPGGRLPFEPATAGTVLAVMPQPADLTPADTSSTVVPGLAAALRTAGYTVQELVVDQVPAADQIAAALDRAATADTIVVGTIDAHRQTGQVDLVDALIRTGRPTVAVALRGPWDVALFPPESTTLATYSILPGSLAALAEVLAGRARATGRLPVSIPR